MPEPRTPDSPDSPDSPPNPARDAVSSSVAPSRRGFVLAGLGAVVAAGGGGAVAALVHKRPAAAPAPVPQSPATLLAAAKAEARLIAAIDATGDPKALAHLRADHVAHLQALVGAASVLQGGSAVATPTVPKSAPISLAELLAAESAASKAAARVAVSLTGPNAALLASIAAAEASHAELLR